MLRGVVITAALVAAFAGPATASAKTTFTVDRNAKVADGQCTADHICKSIADANDNVADGDVVEIKGGNDPYVERPIIVMKQNVTFVAKNGTGDVTVTGAQPFTDVFTFGDTEANNGDGTKLENLTVTVQRQGGRAVFVRAANTHIEHCTLVREELTDVDTPVYDVEDTLQPPIGQLFGIQTIKRSVIIQKPRADAGLEAPAVFGGDSSSLVLGDDFIVAGSSAGSGVRITGNHTEMGPGEDGEMNTDDDEEVAIPNEITRTFILVNKSASNAVEISSPWDSGTPKSLNIDSSILSPGQYGAGLMASSEPPPRDAPAGPLGLPAMSQSGDVEVVMNHTTIAGGDKGVVVQSLATSSISILSGGGSAPHGNVYVDVDRSIVHGDNIVRNFGGDPSLLASQSPNDASLRIIDSDTTATEYSNGTGAEIIVSGNVSNPDTSLFANPEQRDYHLRPDAPVIDKAGPARVGESDRDFEKDDRVVGPASDIGGDEFVNRPPTAVITVNPAKARENQVVTFDGSKSADPEAAFGGSIVGYRWDFGDGTIQNTQTPAVTHKYAQRAVYTATLTTIDNKSGLSAPAAAQIEVVDGNGPAVKIVSPKAGQKIPVTFISSKKRKSTKPAAKKPATARKAAATPNAKTGTPRTTKPKSKVVGGKLRAPLLRFSGTANDDSGIAGVQIALRRLSSGRPVRAKSPRKQCTFFDGKGKFLRLPCKKPRFMWAALKSETEWAYRIKRGTYMRTGTYILTVRAFDKLGNVSTPVTVRFRLG